MAIEIERKFLLRSNAWRGLAQGVPYRQGYIVAGAECTVRVRIAGDRAFLTLKGPVQSFSRQEFEFPIPVADASTMLETLAKGPWVEKMRYRIPFAGLVWEVDEFTGANAGLVLAEVELEHESQPVTLPPWIGQEVTGDLRYHNANLARNPFSGWQQG